MAVTSDNGYKPNGGLRGGARAYRHVIFDADDTLLRYRDDERGAFSRLFARHNVAADDELLAFSNAVSERIWTETGLYDVHSPAIQREYHTLYRAHVEHVFAEIIGYLATRGFFVQGADAKKWRDEFLKELETGGNLMDGAAETLTELRRRGYAVSIATNGLTAIQIGRTKPLSGCSTICSYRKRFAPSNRRRSSFSGCLRGSAQKRKIACLWAIRLLRTWRARTARASIAAFSTPAENIPRAAMRSARVMRA